MKSPKISIIIPVYNGDKYVSLAIESALRQTYENIEIIVVNDGSIDNTEKICKKYGTKIKYIKKQNGGVSTALNLGLKEMTGDYFSWLSHDDLYYPEKVEREVRYLEKNNLLGTNTILYSNFSRIDENGYLIGDIIFDTRVLNRNSAFSILKGGINGITLLIPKKAFEDVGLFDEKLRCVQDYKLWFEMYKKGYKFIHLSDVLAASRIHSEQTTNVSPNVIKEGNAFWLEVIKYFKDDDKINLYGSVYEYYYEIFKFFDNGPYDKVITYCKNKCLEIEDRNKEIIKQTKVSIIIPFHNDTNYAIRAIKSALSQTHKNIEIILINNASTVDSMEINKIVRDNDRTIKYISYKKKQSRVKMWNDGINEATGEYIILFDQYSIMEENRVQVQLYKMVASDVPISDTSYYEYYKEKQNLIDCGFEDGLIVHKIINNCYFKMPVIMIKKSYLIENKIISNDSMQYEEDIIILLKILIQSRILGINKPLNSICKQDEETSIELKIASIVSYVCSDKRFNEYPYEVGRLLTTYKEIVDTHCNIMVNSNIMEQSHKEELRRYAYMQSEEFVNVNRIRNITNKICFKRKVPLYKLDTKTIINSRINRLYRKYKKIIKRGR